MSRCPNGHENPDKQHFCGECGTAIPPVEQVPGAEWAADPTGRHEYRYWDGAAWSEHVADRGITSTDPPSGAEQLPPPPPVVALAPPSPATVGAPMAAGPPPAPAAEPKHRRSRNWLVALVAVVAVVALAGGIALTVGGGADDTTSREESDPAAVNLAACAKARQQFQTWLKADFDAGEAQLTATQDWLEWYDGLLYLPDPNSAGLIAAIDKFNAEVATAQAKQQAANQNRDAYQIAIPQCTVSKLPAACQTDFSQHPGLIDVANRHDAAVDAAVNAIVAQQQALRAGDASAANRATSSYNAAASEHNAATTAFANANSTHNQARASCDAALGNSSSA